MAELVNQYNPDYAIHPGEYLEEVLESRGIKKKDFAERSGLSVKAISQIVQGKSVYSPEVALKFEKTLDVHAEIWIGLVEAYQLFQEREKNRKSLETEKTRKWVTRFPTAELRRMGYLPNTKKLAELADGLLRFLGVASPEAWDDFNAMQVVSYRKSGKFTESPEATSVWLHLAKKAAEKINAATFDKQKFEANLKEIRQLTIQESGSFFGRMVELCAEAGVKLVVVPELKETHISGAALWLNQHQAMIALSLRYRTNDHFWFTFFHEAAHILLHGKKSIFLDKGDGDNSKEETEANHFAGEMLIPEKQYQAFVDCGWFDVGAIKGFAREIGVHPGIVVGRLQHDRLLAHKFQNGLKVQLKLI
ncbi:MAG: HigA family addiction module antitoxin [Spirochaetota bacterium]